MVFDDNIIFAQNYFKVAAGNRYFPNSGISSLGHAIPAAIGARFAAAGPTFAILGDGGFQMCCMEIMTAVNYAHSAQRGGDQQRHHGADPQEPVPALRRALHRLRLRQSRLRACSPQSFGIAHHRIETEADLDDLFDERRPARAPSTSSKSCWTRMLSPVTSPIDNPTTRAGSRRSPRRRAPSPKSSGNCGPAASTRMSLDTYQGAFRRLERLIAAAGRRR